MVEGAYRERRKVLLLLAHTVTDCSDVICGRTGPYGEGTGEACLQSGQIVLPVVPESPSREAAEKWARASPEADPLTVSGSEVYQFYNPE